MEKDAGFPKADALLARETRKVCRRWNVGTILGLVGLI